jgi:hypothetical protein
LRGGEGGGGCGRLETGVGMEGQRE